MPEPPEPTDQPESVAEVEDGEPFSEQLETWLQSEGTKTVGDLGEVFAEKSFAVTVLFLMFLPALPLPTGGITHVFEAITVVVAGQMVIGRRTLWLPARARRRELGSAMVEKAVPFISRRIRWFERFSRPRGVRLFRNRLSLSFVGLVIVAFAVAAALSPPFSGLDTLPSLGAVVVALAIILEDVVVLAIGAAIGLTGIALSITLGAAAVRLVGGLF
ncbi:MAG: exopolysaccharide biosynthesis protein, partial [Acidimicrobiales bacterium]